MDRLFRCLTWACVVALALLSLTPGEIMVRTSAPGLAEHVVAYLGTGTVAAFGYARRASYTHIAAFLIAYAGLLEIGQHWIPGRHSAFIDFMASSAGAISGLIIATIWRALRARTGTFRR